MSSYRQIEVWRALPVGTGHGPVTPEMKKLNRDLRHWEKIYNTVRPHQALGYLTPLQFLRQSSSQRKE